MFIPFVISCHNLLKCHNFIIILLLHIFLFIHDHFVIFQVNNYTYTSIEGRFLVKISTLNAAVHIKEDDLCQIEKYHIRIFEDTPKIKANLMYEPLSSRLQFFICPVYKGNCFIFFSMYFRYFIFLDIKPCCSFVKDVMINDLTK